MRRLVLMIIDSNPFSRSGLRQTLSQQDDVKILEILECDPGQGGQEAMASIAEHSPDIVLLDIDYPSLGRMELAKNITRHFPGTRVVMLSDNPYENEEELFAVIKTGAVAYIRSKHCTTAEFIETIKRASEGEYPINDIVHSSPKVAERVLRQFQDIASMGRTMADVTAPLTPKEVQVLTLIAEGNSNKQIARVLGISDQTIKNHVSAILRKINANYRAHAVFIALRDGLISIKAGHATSSQENDSTEARFA